MNFSQNPKTNMKDIFFQPVWLMSVSRISLRLRHTVKREISFIMNTFSNTFAMMQPPFVLFDFSKYNVRLNIIKQPNYYANNCLFHLTYRRIHGERTIRRRFVKTKQKGPAEINRKAIHKDVQPFVNHLIKKEAGGRRKHIEDRRWFEFGYIDI